jgi:hypothetical protein
MNADKTEAMIMEGGEEPEPISQQAHHRQITKVRKTWIGRTKERNMCNLCGSAVN